MCNKLLVLLGPEKLEEGKSSCLNGEKKLTVILAQEWSFFLGW